MTDSAQTPTPGTAAGEGSSLLDVASMSYEAARDELITVAQALERGGLSLEQTLSYWERGEALATRCEEWLLGAKQRLEQARSRVTAPGSKEENEGESSGSSPASADPLDESEF